MKITKRSKSFFDRGITIKQLISWLIGLPAGLIVVSEIQDLTYWWTQFVALGLLFAILKWNHAFDKEQYINQRRSF